MIPVMRRERGERGYGQTMTEFAIVLPVLFNRYRIDGTPMTLEPWVAASRNTGNGTSDFLGVTVHFTYSWKAGFLAPLGPLRSSVSHYIRLEPQSY